MKKSKIYKVKAAYTFGEEAAIKRQKQLEIVAAAGLAESEPGYVYCTAEKAIDLHLAGYCETYDRDWVKPIFDADAGADVEDLFHILADKLAAASSNSFNESCNQHQPNSALLAIAETKLLEDACTDQVQSELAGGWRILAVQPQPNQRRPDYILGRPLMNAYR